MKKIPERKNISLQSGFSMIELMIVLLIISILTVLTMMSFRAPKLYAADTQAFEVFDVLQEARQRALTQHKTMRVEFNRTRNQVRLIDEATPGTATDDKEVRKILLKNTKEVVVGLPPKNVVNTPSEMSPTPSLDYKVSVHPLSNKDTVATLRFLGNGKVLNAGSNAVGNNSTMTGAAIYVWMPDDTSASSTVNGKIVRSITVQGTSGLSKFLKCGVVNGKCENWN